MEDAQDPDELFDLCDETGVLLGRSKPRALVHRDGDWHRSIHVWVALSDVGIAEGERTPWIVFQRRSLAKDTWPGAIDVAVGGHVRASESILETLRECDEEIGLHLEPHEVVALGVRRRADDKRPGIRDFELQTILFAKTEVPLAALRPHPAEVDSLLALRLGDARDLFAGRLTRATAVRLGKDLELSREELRLDDFLPVGDGYHARALESIAVLLQGGEVHPWQIGSSPHTTGSTGHE